MRDFLLKAWYQPKLKLWLWPLVPLSYLYRLIAFLIKQVKQFQKKKFPIPIVIVGNLTLGGSGKTPVVIALAKMLQSKGYIVGIISRGYQSDAAHAKCPILVTSKSLAQEVGDEPLMIFKATELPVMVGKNRAESIWRLIQDFKVNLIISDDGLQHYQITHDIEICIIDQYRGFGNGFCLPAGPLREPLSRLKHVDFQLTNEVQPLRCYALGVNEKELPLTALKGMKFHAVCGLGHPAKFFRTLETLGVQVIPHAFTDHYCFKADDTHFEDDYPVIMTEKDAVKCLPFANDKMWVLQVEAVLPGKFGDLVISKLKQKIPC